MSKELISRLRDCKHAPAMVLCHEAADALETQERELRVKDLTIGQMANDMAAAQAQLVKLREALDFVLNGSTELDQRASIDKARKALALPTDTTALREMLKAERERCAKVCMQQCRVIEEPHEFERCAEAIREMEDK